MGSALSFTIKSLIGILLNKQDNAQVLKII